MEVEFDATQRFRGIMTFLYIMSLLLFSVGMASSPNVAAILFICAVVFFAAGSVVTNLCKGGAYADDEKLVVYHEFFEKSVFVSVFKFEDIAEVLCDVEIVTKKQGIRRVYYEMVLTVKMKDESEFCIIKGLDIFKDFPAQQPDEYKKYISEQPLMQLSYYIGKRLNLDTSV